VSFHVHQDFSDFGVLNTLEQSIGKPFSSLMHG
jgi:hypothetical protein